MKQGVRKSKCLMIHPEWAVQILDGTKTIEYRSWPTRYRGDFFIGSTATKTLRAFLCAVAHLDDVVYNEKDKIYEWRLSNVREIKPIPIRGQQRLFECGIDDYQVIDDLPDDEYEAVWREAENWIVKQKTA